MADIPPLAEWPDKLPGRLWLPDENHSHQKDPPRGIVVHSGALGPGLARAALRMGISYHFAWSVEHGVFVQLVSMQRRAYHAGSAGNDWLGIAIPGPWDKDPRSPLVKADFQLLVGQIVDAFGGYIQYWTRHSDIEPEKKDPGPGFTADWIEPPLVWVPNLRYAARVDRGQAGEGW